MQQRSKLKSDLIAYGIVAAVLFGVGAWAILPYWLPQNLFALEIRNPRAAPGVVRWAADNTTIWVDRRVNMIAVVEGDAELDTYGEGIARAERWGPSFVEFRDGRRVERMEDTLLFVYKDRQEVVRRLEPNQTQWFMRESPPRLENPWEDVPETLDQYEGPVEANELPRPNKPN